ncbi:unnamed protein product [Blepharisma stoltei]|uniref:Uncharacterized protein n=1 Tax=Blepharisma stoltei TaxID=1481888 RepID=A0AAU9ICG5_9CILI|nr:unnamed protein product [Blepharisma stoltei]
MSDWFEENKHKLTPEEREQIESWDRWKSNMSMIGCGVSLVANFFIFKNKQFMNFCLQSTPGKINLLLIGLTPVWAGYYCSVPAKKEKNKLIAELTEKYSPEIPQEPKSQLTN